MKHISLALAAFTLALPASAQEAEPAPGPSDIINGAGQEDWTVVAPEDLLVMTLAPDAEGKERTVILQLMPAPFSQGWVENIRTLARAEWYDGTSINRVQDNYVVQWGDPNYDNPESGGEAKPLPDGLNVMDEAEYTFREGDEGTEYFREIEDNLGNWIKRRFAPAKPPPPSSASPEQIRAAFLGDQYAMIHGWFQGWPLAFDSGEGEGGDGKGAGWPIHCYGMVGVGRNYSPDTGSGAELYTVIGHAPRHLDRNIALVGRIIEGMEHLSSLPRGTGALGFYSKEETDKRTPILSIRVASDLPETEQPQFEYLSTETETFAKYAEARANRRDPFFIVPAGGADICNIPVPVRRFEYADEAAE
ncbi:MAG: peptidylprolyl isomerase [Pseudomonadota bacterium]